MYMCIIILGLSANNEMKFENSRSHESGLQVKGHLACLYYS